MAIFLLILSVLIFARPIVSDCVVDSETETQYKDLIKPLMEQHLTLTDSAGNYSYDIRFCNAIEGQSTKDVGVLQTELKPDKPSAPQKVVIGRITATDIKTGSDWILLTYKNGETYHSHCGHEARQAHIMMLCDSKQLVGKHAVVEENNQKDRDCSYIFELATSAACTAPSVSPIQGLSIGSIIVIITVSVIVAYIILGFIYQRCFMGAKGIEQFPNISFWRDFGNLVADGCVLVFRTNPPQESRSYKGLGDDQLGFDEDEERDDHMLPM
ncbi:cation-dependent mannose-6-phosphate receptor-like isoform X2 [Acanthaster planci]|uniref:Cation-dependent mannose-6-phosphate receptor-like isoform X1 n=1 Tax=Acanthaster planci TaxID=133434 RepID=A0A8B8A2W4_ACAPL|nr:cation-dependent mannose-6-phosphate receptor-like isoform X1 [Acanthaster planci]XP_022110221.1 cation-dependent mannose-6-phosphate receptor-like isoform X2 [Acanthaster planci]